MRDTVTVSVSGLSEFQQKLEELSDKAGTQTIRAALRAGGTEVKNEMVLLAPHGETNTLAGPKNFDVKTRKQSGLALAMTAFIGPNGRRGIYRRDKGDTKGLPRTAAFICKLLEWGSATRAKRPFCTQAFEVSTGKALDAIINTLKERLGF